MKIVPLMVSLLVGAASTAWAGSTNDNPHVSLNPPSKLLNISTRMRVLTEDNVLIGGFIINGTASKSVIVRAIGPALIPFGVAGALADPTLELHLPDGSVINNNDWKDTQQSAIEGTGLQPSDESAILQTLEPGSYTAIVRGVNNTIGIGLVEAYEHQHARLCRYRR